jgi:hypothetical protein
MMNALETDLPNFAHVIGDLGSTIHFRKLWLSGTNAAFWARVSMVTRFLTLADTLSLCSRYLLILGCYLLHLQALLLRLVDPIFISAYSVC